MITNSIVLDYSSSSGINKVFDLAVNSMGTLYKVIMDWLKILVPFGLGIILGIIVRCWEINRMRPIITFQDTLATRGYHLRDENGDRNGIVASTLNTLNIISGTLDCKLYIELPHNETKRTGCMLPDDNTQLLVTLTYPGVNIQEFADLSTISEERRTRGSTYEHGLRGGKIESCVPLPGTGNIPATKSVASSNAHPAARGIILHANPISNENNPGRIVEFLE